MTAIHRPALAHPASVAAIAVLVINDHLLKQVWPGFVTGKLSDVAGLVFFPLLAIAAYELVANRRAGRAVGMVAVVATGIVFAVIQLWEPAADAYVGVMGYLQWPFRIMLDGAGSPSPVAHTADPTDLLTLPALWLAWIIATASANQCAPGTYARLASRPALRSDM